MSYNNTIALPNIDNVPAPIYKLAERFGSEWASKTLQHGMKQDFVSRKKYMTTITAAIIWEHKLNGETMDSEYFEWLEKNVDHITSQYYYEDCVNSWKAVGQDGSGKNFTGLHPIDRDDYKRASKVKARLKRKRDNMSK